MRLLDRSQRFFCKAARYARGTWRLLWREPQDFFLLSRMAFCVSAVALLIRILPLPRLFQLLTPRSSRASKGDQKAALSRLGRLIDLLLGTDLLCFTPTCWKRAAVLYRYLALEGIETRVVFGVRLEDEDLLAGHAWLELEGLPVLEKSAPKYLVTYSFPARFSAEQTISHHSR